MEFCEKKQVVTGRNLRKAPKKKTEGGGMPNSVVNVEKPRESARGL